MASKRDYTKEVTKQVKRTRALDKIYGSRPRGTAASRRKEAAYALDLRTEESVRGYVSGSIRDPAVKKRSAEYQAEQKTATMSSSKSTGVKGRKGRK